jgi:hypothetical protein
MSNCRDCVPNYTNSSLRPAFEDGREGDGCAGCGGAGFGSSAAGAEREQREQCLVRGAEQGQFEDAVSGGGGGAGG